jgi:hypothetical protein
LLCKNRMKYEAVHISSTQPCLQQRKVSTKNDL